MKLLTLWFFIQGYICRFSTCLSGLCLLRALDSLFLFLGANARLACFIQDSVSLLSPSSYFRRSYKFSLTTQGKHPNPGCPFSSNTTFQNPINLSLNNGGHSSIFDSYRDCKLLTPSSRGIFGSIRRNILGPIGA